MPRPFRHLLAFGLLSAVLFSGCSPGSPEPVTPRVSAPGERTTVLAEGNASGIALTTTQALYDEAPVVVLAPAGDHGAQARAASTAVALGAPVLLAPGGDAGASGEPGEEPAGSVSAELERLATATVLTFGAESTRWARGLEGVDVVAAPGDAGDLADAAKVSFSDSREVPAANLTRAVAALTSEEPELLEVGGASAPAPPPDPAAEEEDPEMPEHEAAAPLDGLTVLASPGRAHVAATATARAAGARLLVVADGDPRADREAIQALSDQPPGELLALGEDFGAAEQVRQRVDVAATGVELPGGGQVVFPHRRMVALYGHPGSDALGALGEQSLEATIERARRVAGEYDDHSDQTVIPAFEIIATIASSSPGPQGDYSIRTPVSELRPWVDAAREAGIYVVLDLQPGRSDFLSQARQYERLLAEPHVGLALDPEWRLRPDQVHLRQIGSVGADEINSVVTWLGDLTREHQLPQKLLILHQFQLAMIADRDQVDTSRDELAVLVHADGHGSPDLKRGTWQVLTQDASDDLWWGWKNFYDEDTPTWTPGQTMELEPSIKFVSYQ